MSFESQLKETFMKHAEDVRPDTHSWPVIEKRRSPRYRWDKPRTRRSFRRAQTIFSGLS